MKRRRLHSQSVRTKYIHKVSNTKLNGLDQTNKERNRNDLEPEFDKIDQKNAISHQTQKHIVIFEHNAKIHCYFRTFLRASL